MGIFSSLVSSIVKTAIIPVAVTKDIINVVSGEEPNATSGLTESIEDDFDDFFS